VPTYNIAAITTGPQIHIQSTLSRNLPGHHHRNGTIRAWQRTTPGVSFQPGHPGCASSDGSGTTFVWTTTLPKVNPIGRPKVGGNTS